MARFILACLAALVFAVGPSSVFATRAGCARAMAGPMAMSDQAPAAVRDGSIAKAPLCNHAAKGCARACAMICAAAAVTPARLDGVVRFGAVASAEPRPGLLSPLHEPARFDPPPR